MSNPAHYIAVIGGAVSGSVTAFKFASRGIKTVIFDQQTLPYGKIEDGLPKWHSKLRDKEEGKIDERLVHPNITYVPNVRLGSDITFEELNSWGFSAIVLATGAFNDRPLPVDGIDEYVNNGFYYQNPFFIWYNHFHEENYEGLKHDIVDDAVVVGGGLVSLDVVKALMIESVKEKLQEKGHEVDMFTLDRSIVKVLDELGYTLDDLGLKGCSLYYRRRMIDMPVTPMATDTPEALEKAQGIRAKLLNNFTTKYLFRFYECHAPIDKIVEDGKLAGLVFQKTEVIDGKAVAIEGTEIKVEAALVISSIGSIPELLEGIPSQWQMFKISDMNTCQIEGYDNVFAVGNAVTGQGNIKESFKHGNELSGRIMDDSLGWTEEHFEAYSEITASNVSDQASEIANKFSENNLLSAEKVAEIDSKIGELHAKSGYSGDYQAWRDANIPTRLEDMLGIEH
ncbi:MAG: FAD-dependent oxidoreductase [Flavobacteriales bacterium]|nr:FAD-dependent oxidoreductase [Flavobacteriales bacterium]